MIRFDATTEERAAITRIVKRFRELCTGLGLTPRPQLDLEMDLIATHANGCPLDFAKLEAASDFDLAHDVGGIQASLDRDDNSPTAGQLLNCFLPRCHA